MIEFYIVLIEIKDDIEEDKQFFHRNEKNTPWRKQQTIETTAGLHTQHDQKIISRCLQI